MAGKGSVNKVILVGNLGADAEVQETPNGVPVVTLSLATNEVFKDKDGNKNQTVEWHRVVLWRQLAKAAGQYLKKGNKIYIEGKLATRSWEDNDGTKRKSTEIVADAMTMLDGPGEEQEVPPEGQNS
jgi:single-strand DNA-binding protein